MTLQNFASNIGHKDDYDWVHTEARNACSENEKFSKDTFDLLFESAYTISEANGKHNRRKQHENLVIISPEPATARNSDICADIGTFTSDDFTAWIQTPPSSDKKQEKNINRRQNSLESELQFRDPNGGLITDWPSPCSGVGPGHVDMAIKVRDVKCLYSQMEVSKDVSIRNMCMSVLGSQGLLDGDRSPSEIRREVLENSKVIDSLQPCEICGDVDMTQNMLLCDHCEEAFHASCINLRTKRFDADEWFCQSCSKLRSKSSLEGQFFRLLEKNCSNRNSNIGLSSVQIMMKNHDAYVSRVRIGECFQAEVPEWSGQTSSSDCDCIDEAFEMDLSEPVDSNVSFKGKFPKSNLLSNWLQCRGVLHDDERGSSEEPICGKWRRAPLSKVQTNDWDCSCSIPWDPSHSDCAVPQELPTEQVLLQLKYIERLRPRFATKRT